MTWTAEIITSQKERDTEVSRRTNLDSIESTAAFRMANLPSAQAPKGELYALFSALPDGILS